MSSLKFPLKLNQIKVPGFLRELSLGSPQKWEKLGEDNLLKLFQFMARKVPAYQVFLKENGIKPSEIKSISDLGKVPVSDKDNYLRKYKYQDLFPDRVINQATTVSATSGSTGEPFYFPRGEYHDDQYRLLAELFLRSQFEIAKKTTLGIVGFGIGIWIGGIFTYKNFNRIAYDNSFNFTLIPTGANIETILKAIKKFGPEYEQIILMGYPPFVKDVIDEASEYGINWRKFKVRVLTAAEGYPEKYRDYLKKKLGMENILTDAVNMYGTVELGTMAHETPLTVLIRRMAVNNKKLFKALFPDAHRTPTLVQYHPYMVHFAVENGEILASGYGSSIPLIRYRFPDRGGVIPFSKMAALFKSQGLDLNSEIKKAKIGNVFKLPFVYVYDRSDNAIILRGANIFPDEIKEILQSAPLEKFVTGKFTMEKKQDSRLNDSLVINVEIKKRVKETAILRKTVSKTILLNLIKNNSEFNYIYTHAPEKVAPTIMLWPYKHPKYFSGVGKQKWAINPK